jgi:RNA polymerase sigma-70 factor (ECF subfamily)
MNDVSNKCNVNVKVFRDQLRAFISKRVSNQEDVEDILREVFIKAQTNVASLKDAKRCIPWVYQITRNTIIDYYYKNKRNYLNTEISEELTDVSDNEIISREEITQGLKPFIEALPKKYRDALRAIDINGLTHKEYSEQQGISLTCSKSRVQRGRKMVKERLLDCCVFNSDVYGNVFDYDEIKNHKKD